MSWDYNSFKEKVESEHDFPGIYLFKFIVPFSKKDEVLELLPKGNISFRGSSNNKYVSISLESKVDSSDQVIEIYKSVHSIEGLIAL